MKRRYKFCICALLLCVCWGVAGCAPESDMEEGENIEQEDAATNVVDIYDLIVEKATQLAEQGTFEDGDIYVDSILYGNYSQPDEAELLALCKFKNNPHVAGLDRTLAIIFSQESMEVVAYKNFGADEVTLQCLPTEGASKILFLGRSFSTGLTIQYMELYAIQDGEWVEVSIEGLNLDGDELCYITEDNNLIVVPRENGAYPTQMFVLWDEQIMYSWDEHAEQFINKEISTESGRRILWQDLDGNGEPEYFILSGDGVGTLSLYFNNEVIYQYEEQYMHIGSIVEKEYIDLDYDGENEIFVSFTPNANSAPLMEWFVLKEKEGKWELLEMYHQNDDMTQNAFPISVTMKEKDFIFSIVCEGCDKELVYDATNHYEHKKADKESGDNSYDYFMESNFQVGDIVGETSAWGVWSIESGIYEGQNCLIAEHGLIGAGGKFDFYGHLDVYFCYDENGKIKILDIVFREQE